MDFKSKFDLEEKQPDYSLGFEITEDLETGKIHLDPSKYIRETIAKYNMTEAVTSPLPIPAGTKIYMSREDETDILDAEATNLSLPADDRIDYVLLIIATRPYVLRLTIKQSHESTNWAHMGLARKVLQYLRGTYDNVITYSPVGCGGFEEKDCSLNVILGFRLGMCIGYKSISWMSCIDVSWRTNILEK